MANRQAGHYGGGTNTGGGLREAYEMVRDHSRPGSRKTILLMTDGNANTYEDQYGNRKHRFVLVAVRRDGLVQARPQRRDAVPPPVAGLVRRRAVGRGRQYKAKMYVIKMAEVAINDDFTIHTLAVGADADRDLMEAIANFGDGEFISVNGALSTADLEAQVEAAFQRIGALVPPAKLANPE